MAYEAQERKDGGGQERTATLQLVIALSRAFQALERAVRPHLTEHGLGLTEFAVLEVLYHKGVLPLGEIRDRILVTGASTTYVVKSSRTIVCCVEEYAKKTNGLSSGS
jgi:hypothetical protein